MTRHTLFLVAVLATVSLPALGQAPTTPGLDWLISPPGELIEVGGMGLLSDGRLVLGTRRGRVWIVENAEAEDPAQAKWSLFAEGLHEALGIEIVDDVVHVQQRGEISRLVDGDGDGRAERVEVVGSDWGMTGNYHEFAYGIPRDREGRFHVALNVGFWNPQWWHGRSRVPWRGWVLRIDEQGRTAPMAPGLRSPNGLVLNGDDDLFVTDNQGDWMPVCPLFHIEEGKFYGHPGGLQWTEAYRGEGRIPSDTEPPDWPRAPAAMWFPYELSRSAAGMVFDTEGHTGPFKDQLYVAELTNGQIVRVMLEKVRGQWQGACLLHARGVGCANRLVFGKEGTLFAGLTERGWGGTGRRTGVARLKAPVDPAFAIRNVRLLDDGFEVAFTAPLGASPDPAAIKVGEYDYNWWWKYGSPKTNEKALAVSGVDAMAKAGILRLRIPELRGGMMVKVIFEGLRDASGRPLEHPRFDYTLNQMTSGPLTEKLVANRVPPPPTSEVESEGWLGISNGAWTDDWSGPGWGVANIALDDPSQTAFKVTKGASAYVNEPEKGRGDFVWAHAHRDAEVELEFCLPKGGDGSIRLMGLYELRLRDSHGAAGPNSAWCGAVSEAAGSRRSVAPRENACLRPGEWQKLKLRFIAPRAGAPAVFEQVILNDRLLHERVEVAHALGSPPPAAGEAGPFALGGRRGQIAFRGVRLRPSWHGVGSLAGRDLLAEGLPAWRAVGWTSWKIDNGQLSASGEPGLLLRRLPEGPFTLRGRFRLSHRGRAHLRLRARSDLEKPGGYAVVLDQDWRAREGTGSIAGHVRVNGLVLTARVWTDFEITCTPQGDATELAVRLNGIEVARFVDAKGLHAGRRLALEIVKSGTKLDLRELRVERR